MKQSLFFCTIYCLFTLNAFAQESKDVQAVRDILAVQQQHWNEGKIESFMEAGYWKSPQLKFIGKSGVTYGYEATLQRYLRNYPNRDAMGILTFEIISVEKLSGKVIFMVGKWHLDRKNDAPEGHFSLIFRKIKGKWKIVADHSS